MNTNTSPSMNPFYSVILGFIHYSAAQLGRGSRPLFWSLPSPLDEVGPANEWVAAISGRQGW